ncbi:MAG: SMP-30/gluconolactonase/LRE family protein [Pseudomonadales bacterium]
MNLATLGKATGSLPGMNPTPRTAATEALREIDGGARRGVGCFSSAAATNNTPKSMMRKRMLEFSEVASGLLFPEGPIAMPDGSVLLVEIRRGTLSRVTPDGMVEVVAALGGGPNGAAIGPDGRCYVCNNGGFEWVEAHGSFFPGHQPADYSGGRIEAVDLHTGKFEVLYTACDGVPLRGPNDIVFDRQGGFYFTDLGKTREREMDRGAVYYATPDGASIREVLFPSLSPNGVGLSPDEDRLYVAETLTGRLMGYPITAPGQLGPIDPVQALVAGFESYQFFDSLAVDAEGNVCVATLLNGGITIIPPDGRTPRHVPTGDMMTTNICFGGDDLRTAYITCSMTGRLVSCRWETPGLPLNFLNRWQDPTRTGQPMRT